MLLNNLQNNYKYALAKMRLDSHKSFMLANLAQAWWPRLYHEWWRVKATPTIFANLPIADSISRVSWKLALNAWGMHSNEQTNVGISAWFHKIWFLNLSCLNLIWRTKYILWSSEGLWYTPPRPIIPCSIYSCISTLISFQWDRTISFISLAISWHVYPIHLFRHRT